MAKAAMPMRRRIRNTVVVMLTLLAPLCLMVVITNTTPGLLLRAEHSSNTSRATNEPMVHVEPSANSTRRVPETARTNTHKHQICLLYDKAPRTGSTTITKALGRCWKSLGISIAPALHLPYGKVVDAMLRLPDARVAIADVHMSVLDADVAALGHSCGTLMYITSTRPMRERLLSEAKYVVSDANIRINTSVSTDDLQDVWREMRERQKVSENVFETYPFRQSRRLQADYIIRSDRLGDDLSDLLDAFGCPTKFRSRNIHGLEEEEFSVTLVENGVESTKRLSDLPLDMNDRRHASLSTIAAGVNQEGIALAKRIAELPLMA